MIESFRDALKHIDWILVGAVLVITGFGLITMYSYAGQNNYFERQVVWVFISLAAMITVSFFDFRFLRRTSVVVSAFLASALLLTILLVIGHVAKGARSWFNFGIIAFQPSDPIKLVVILILAKYFARRHIAIANIRHILISGLYAFVLFILVFLQPDLGSAIIIFSIWLGMVLVSGISKKHLLVVFLTVAIAFGCVWFSPLLLPHQRQRIMTFFHPLQDIQGTGYSAYQSVIAVGSGEVMGKGVGFGTQSKLKFLPEYQTDFIFAAFAEEWGFVGIIVLFLLYAIVIWRLLNAAYLGETNFETLFCAGVAVLFMSHFVIHVGINLGLLPVTGTTIPFMSYGGSHLLTEFFAVGVVLAMRKYKKAMPKNSIQDSELISI